VTYPGFTPVGNATLVVANVLTCNKHSQKPARHVPQTSVDAKCVVVCSQIRTKSIDNWLYAKKL
jgi:hypothetical protein